MKYKIMAILNKNLPLNAYRVIEERKTMFFDPYLKISFACSDKNIHNVAGQKPQIVSLRLILNSLELTTQVYGGNGGQHIYRKPDMEHPRERFLAMKSIKIPFRQPKKEEKFVLNAIDKFAKNWVLALVEHKDTLMYQDLVNYDELLT